MVVPLLALGPFFFTGLALPGGVVDGRRHGGGIGRGRGGFRTRDADRATRRSTFLTMIGGRVRHRGAEPREVVAQELPREPSDRRARASRHVDRAEEPARLRRAARAAVGAGSRSIARSRSSWSTSITSRPTTIATVTRPATKRCAASRRRCRASSRARSTCSRATAAKSSRWFVRHRFERGRERRGADAQRGRRARDQARGLAAGGIGHDQHRRRGRSSRARSAAHAGRCSSRIRRCTRRR